MLFVCFFWGGVGLSIEKVLCIINTVNKTTYDLMK